MNTEALIKRTRKLKINREVIPFDRINRVLIVWEGNQDKAQVDEIKAFGHELRNKGKDITFLTYYPMKKLDKDMQANEIYKLCCKSDFSMFLVPKSKQIKDILSENFDLLINGCLDGNDYLKTIAAYSKAKFRIGPYNDQADTSLYEISIKPNGADLCENYLIETGRYLRKIVS